MAVARQDMKYHVSTFMYSAPFIAQRRGGAHPNLPLRKHPVNGGALVETEPGICTGLRNGAVAVAIPLENIAVGSHCPSLRRHS